MVTDTQLIAAYQKHQRLFDVAEEVGLPWQTVYARLRRAGFVVTGNKERWGSKKDKLGAKGEREFQRYIPEAKNQNEISFQPKFDFIVGTMTVDVKSARRARGNAKYPGTRWSFYMKKQVTAADFIVCFGFDEAGEHVERCFLIPTDLVAAMDTLSIATSGKSKWHKFEIEPQSLRDFFSELTELS